VTDRGEPTPTAFNTGLRRRMMTGYLMLLVLIYELGVLQAWLVDDTPTLAAGESLAVLFCAAGLLCCLPKKERLWQYVVALTCAVGAPIVALLFHQVLMAQSWSVLPLMFTAVFVRTWHRTAVARVIVVAIWVAASIALLVAPAEVPLIWLIFYGVSIIGAAEVFGLASAALVDTALRDPLTKVWNRAGIDRQAKRVLSQARRRGESVAVIVFDFDDFKVVNDRDGHAAGDAALAEFSGLVLGRLPKSAVFGRLGGDEFVVILGGCDHLAARELAGVLVDGHRVHVSFGVAAGATDSRSIGELFDAADADLYKRKRSRKKLSDLDD
jgi:diguanylate cyclase (GGDEF)-like protein